MVKFFGGHFMLSSGDFSILKWNTICQDSNCTAYSPCDHSHEFNLKKELKNKCNICNCEMKLDGQVYRCEIGKDEAYFFNAYECTSCKNTGEIELYKGRVLPLQDMVSKI